ncbi:MAG: SLBB domain-containing protein [Armatimonadetes bacterium]|nr:SLBB domain-containing protein [Armatimonadota bacterium]
MLRTRPHSSPVKPLWRLLLLAASVAGLSAVGTHAAEAPAPSGPRAAGQPAAERPSAPAAFSRPAATADPDEAPAPRPEIRQPVPMLTPAERAAEWAAAAAGLSQLRPFGYDFFAGAPTTDFTVAPSAPIPPGYQLGPQDKLRIRWWTPTIAETTQELTVAENGAVGIPGVGDIMAAGITIDKFRQRLGQRLHEQFKSPSFAADLVDPRTITVFVSGAARRPGRYVARGDANLFNLVYAAGGATELGSLRRVALRRANRTVVEMDVYRFLIQGELAGGVPLRDEDIVFFPTAGPRVSVTGEVSRPAIYEAKEGERLSDVLAMAGGLKASAFPRILRLRRVEGGRRVERTLDALAFLADPKHADNLVVRDGDFIALDNVSPTVRERVTIRGNVGFPGDYSLRRTPTAKALFTEANPRIGTYWQRADLTRLLPDGTPVVIPLPLQEILEGKAKDIELMDLDEVYVYEANEKQIVALAAIEGAVKNPAIYRVAEGMRVRDLIFAAGGVLQEAANDVAHLYRRIGPGEFRLVRIDPSAADRGSASDNLALQDQDRLVIYRQREVEFKAERVTVVGEVQRPGSFRTYEGMTAYDILLIAGGPTDQAAGTIEIATPVVDEKSNKRAEVKALKLADVLDGAHRDEPIKSGMLISVPRREDRLTQPFKVELRGRFRRPGTYALLYEGEDLKSLMERAGGLADDADPFGLSLTRTRDKILSTATDEQVRTVMQWMDQLLPSLGGDTAARSGTTAQMLDVESGSRSVPLMGSSGGTTKVLLVSPRRLATMQSGTRVGFDMENRADYVTRIGQIRLTDGDVIEVPRRSEVVQVLGAVQSPGPVYYTAGQSPKHYISSAGGGAPDADLKRSVVVKVSGAVRRFADVKSMDPGDVIVVSSKHQIIQPPVARRPQDTLFDVLGLYLVVRGLSR